MAHLIERYYADIQQHAIESDASYEELHGVERRRLFKLNRFDMYF